MHSSPMHVEGEEGWVEHDWEGVWEMYAIILFHGVMFGYMTD